MERKVSIIEDLDGKKVVFIHDIRFKGKRMINWEEVEAYLREYIGEFFYVAETQEEIFIGTDLPSEYAGSIYSKRLKGTNAKAKANATQGIPEMIEIATNKEYEENHKNKHSKDAKNGWYRYDTRFALPVFDEDGEVERYNVFNARLLVRHAGSGKKYLYDIMEIKKKRAIAVRNKSLPATKPIS
jgi:hypothetical protein